ncbi:MAG: hypothetical protein PHO44_01520 [Sphaerochaetaceae bacterium]|nr:hypothetical protein [Sphaerochaetaceae bacterium]MDD3163849.1 hypothetical protein [Sphaerochaetaceae bacterium]MDD4006637.1 hypothetical protein [Sphaerochaetaceae bacterium]
MEETLRCPNPKCMLHDAEDIEFLHWYSPHGSYISRHHGLVRRYRCKACGTTFSKRTGTDSFRLQRDDIDPHKVFSQWCLGRSIRDIARSYRCSPSMIRTRIRKFEETEDEKRHQRLNTSSANPGNASKWITFS